MELLSFSRAIVHQAISRCSWSCRQTRLDPVSDPEMSMHAGKLQTLQTELQPELHAIPWSTNILGTQSIGHSTFGLSMMATMTAQRDA